MLLRPTSKQRQKANVLIKRLCVNYDNDLALDDGGDSVCVQGISYSLLRGYFRNTVLPSEPILEENILGTRFEKCVSCGAPIIKKRQPQKILRQMCHRAYRKQQSEYARKKRAKSKK